MLEIILYLWFTISCFHYWTHCAVKWNSKHLVADLSRQHHACKTLTRNCIWLLRINKTWDDFHLHYCFTSPTKEDRVPKLVSASLRIHGSWGGFLLPSVTAHNQPFCPSISIPYCDPSRSRQDAQYKPASSANLALPALLANIIMHNSKLCAFHTKLFC